jgi:hypothetical protein
MSEEIIICPVCKDAGSESTVQRSETSSTLVGYRSYYDEKGRYHDHNDNCLITSFRCSRGHVFTYRPQRTCWCGWKGKEDCFCHPLGFKIYPTSPSPDCTPIAPPRSKEE